MRTVRRTFWITWISWAVLGGLSEKAGIPGLPGLFMFLFVLWIFFGYILSRWIAVMIVSSLRCKCCGLEIPAVSQWKIGQYTDHRERHIFNAKSPIDGMRIGHINCPQCEATILV